MSLAQTFVYVNLTGIYHTDNGRKSVFYKNNKNHQERLENIKQESEQILQEAREKQTLILKEAAETREAIVEKARQVAREEGARMLEEAKRQIEVEKQNAIRDIRTQVAELSVQIAEKVMRENLASDAQQMSLVNRFLDDAFSVNPN